MKRIICFFCFLFLSLSALASPISKVVFYGDSLTDNGNLFSLYGLPIAPPYNEHRFSNDLVWSDYFSQYLQENFNISSTNYAYGGATAYAHSSEYDGNVAPSTLYLEYVESAPWYNASSVLYSIWIGSNDYLYDTQPDQDALTTEVVSNIIYTINQLINYANAKYFLIFNVPDLSRTPYGKDHNTDNRLQTLSQLHNTKLAKAIAALKVEHPDVTFVSIDIENTLNAVLDNLALFNQIYGTHVQDTSDPCWPGDMTGRANLKLTQMIKTRYPDKNASLISAQFMKNPDVSSVLSANQTFEEGLHACPDPDNYAFFDNVHPTSPVHKALSQVVIQSLQQQNLL